MRYAYIFLFCMLVLTIFVQPVFAQEKTLKEQRAERLHSLEDRFFAAQKEGKTIKGVLVEGNSFFNGTTDPQKKPYGKPYTDAELRTALRSAERNSKVFLLAQDGTLYYPTVKKGEADSESLGAYRFERVLTEAQKKTKTFTWATLVPMVGREIEVLGEVYPGYGGVKGLYIEAVGFEGEYIVGKN
ncbi:MAG: hypothetical protein JW832_02665 [Deltaproteobacteria bacterium]|nr:hypothetical protein [Deltaproteobacteria bacterium]